MLIDASSRYHNLKLDEKSSYLTFSFQFGMYEHIRLPFEAALAGNMFQKKKDKLFDDIPNVFDIADDILITGCDAASSNHDENLEQVLQRSRQANQRLNKEKCLFR